MNSRAKSPQNLGRDRLPGIPRGGGEPPQNGGSSLGFSDSRKTYIESDVIASENQAAARSPEPSGPSPEYLTPEQVHAMLQLSTKTIYRLASADPSMPVLRIGGSVRFPRERLLRWLQAREQGPGRPRRLRGPSPLGAQVPAGSDNGAGVPTVCADLCATEAVQKPAP